MSNYDNLIFTLTIFIDLQKSNNLDIVRLIEDIKIFDNTLDMILPYTFKFSGYLEEIYDDTKSKIIVKFEKNSSWRCSSIGIYNKLIKAIDTYLNLYNFVYYEIIQNVEAFNIYHKIKSR